MPFVRHVTDAGLAKETDLYFMAVVERGTGKHVSMWLLISAFIFKTEVF